MVRHLRVMVVDDDVGIRTLLHLALAGRGHTVHAVSSATAAADDIDAFRPHVVLMDLGLDGSALAAVAAAHAGRPPARVVILSAAHDAGDEVDRLGADGYLAKPFDLPDLYAIVEDPEGAASR